MGMYVYETELYHWGTKGMKWGVRRYQNKDGTLTEAGKKRYARDAREKNWTMGDDGIARSGGKKNRKEEKADANRWVKEDMERSKRVANSSEEMTRSLQRLNSSTTKAQSKKRMDLSSMSDKELRDQINRELLERQYNDVFSPAKESKGRQYLETTLEVGGAVLGVAGSALGIALAIKELRG